MLEPLSLAQQPTPIQRLHRTSARLGVELWVKRDDLTGAGLSGNKVRKLEYLLADAHALPFRDHVFDRVLHVGGINGFDRPEVALQEMARVARPGTPIVVVDESLDPARDNNLYHRAMFELATFYEPDPRAPVDLLPHGAEVVQNVHISRFLYCLTFRMPQLEHEAARSDERSPLRMASPAAAARRQARRP